MTHDDINRIQSREFRNTAADDIQVTGFAKGPTTILITASIQTSTLQIAEMAIVIAQGLHIVSRAKHAAGRANLSFRTL
jgi:hypothetical protein